MSFEIDDFLSGATKRSDIQNDIRAAHDNLYAAFKIVSSVYRALEIKSTPSEQLVAIVFKELMSRTAQED